MNLELDDGAFARLADFVPAPAARRGPRTKAADRDRKRAERKLENARRAEDIAVLDFETSPFDASKPGVRIEPFLAVLYRPDKQAIIWENDEESFVAKVIEAIEALPRKFTVYAHNGGKFDFIFLISRIRGDVQFKGRGLMTAKIGPHDLRDSYLIIPAKLANYKKTAFDYRKLTPEKRDAYREEIISYCVDDAKNTFELVRDFVDEHGFKLTVGQAAMSRIKAVQPFKRVSQHMDAYLRHFFFGGRVECIAGLGEHHGNFTLFDLNSAYPDAMAHCRHPTGSQYSPRRGEPNEHTCFVDLTCRNRGALIGADERGRISADIPSGRFKTTIHEYKVASELGLISDVKINWSIDCEEFSDFSGFILPIYEERQRTKQRLEELKSDGKGEGEKEFDAISRRDLLLKLVCNSGYGKFAQNPRRFHECFITGLDERPPGVWMANDDAQHRALAYPVYEFDHFSIAERSFRVWQRPSRRKYFNNVGTAASITGKVRSTLLAALAQSVNPIYCDTDSIICEGLKNVPESQTDLGAWKTEGKFKTVLIVGKKLYAAIPHGVSDLSDKRIKIRSKGVSGLTYAELDCIANGAEFPVTNQAPTFSRFGEQYYITRNIRSTVEKGKVQWQSKAA